MLRNNYSGVWKIFFSAEKIFSAKKNRWGREKNSWQEKSRRRSGDRNRTAEGVGAFGCS
jgi:hypothetical protein